MPTNKYGTEVPAKLLYQLNNHPDPKKCKTFREISKEFDLSVGQVAGAIKRYRPDEPEPPYFINFKLENRQIYDDDNCIVAGDFQLPTTDWDFAGLVAEVAKKHIKGDKILYIMGDWVNIDALSKYDKLVNTPTWDEEVAASKYLLTNYLNVFDEIRFFPGNHERRWQKHLNGNDPTLRGLVEQLFPVKGRERIKYSVFDRVEVNNSTGKWMFVHGKNYSQIHLVNANKYALKFGCHVISHHEHKAAIGMSKYGDHFIVDNGGLFDADKMAYVQLDTSTSPNMAQAFTMIKNGHPYLFAGFTDWNEWI